MIKKQLGQKTTLLLMAVMVLISTSSCDKFLDVHPDGELPEEQLLINPEGFESALFGVYGTMNGGQLYGQNLSHNLLDVMAQYFVCQGNNDVINLLQYNYTFSSVESLLEDVWTNAYSDIANANNVLKNLEDFSPETLEYYNLYKGESLGLRAFMHFDLLRLFGENIQLNSGAEGIPYSKGFSLNAPDFVSLQSDYDDIITDLKTAEDLLQQDQDFFTNPKTNPDYPFLRDRETHFNLYAVQATLARVYLTMGDLPNAATYAEKVINSGKFGLLEKAEIGNGVGKGVLYPKETIFGLYSNKYFQVVNDRFALQTSFFSYDLRNDVSNTYNDIQGGHDFRWDGFFRQPANSLAAIRFVKLVDPYQENDEEYLRPEEYIKGINLIRLPEMYYIAAEALLPTDPSKARDYFDLVLRSRGLDALKDRNPEVPLSLEMITEDRYKEMIGEGQTFFNMKRLNLDLINNQLQTIPASRSVYVPPIPNIEFDYRN